MLLIAASMQELHDLTEKVRNAIEAAGLFLNVSKIKVMKVTQKPNGENLVMGNQVVENIEKLNYLGAVIINNLD